MTLPVEPPRREDGYCYRYPTCRRKVPTATHRHIRYGGDSLDKEPFCSVDCARKHYGTSTTIARTRGGVPTHKNAAGISSREDASPDKEKEPSQPS